MHGRAHRKTVCSSHSEGRQRYTPGEECEVTCPFLVLNHAPLLFWCFRQQTHWFCLESEKKFFHVCRTRFVHLLIRGLSPEKSGFIEQHKIWKIIFFKCQLDSIQRMGTDWHECCPSTLSACEDPGTPAQLQGATCIPDHSGCPGSSGDRS